MQDREIELTPAFVSLMATGFVGLFAVIGIATTQVFKLITLQVSLPSISNIGKVELALICLLLLVQIVSALLTRFTSAASQDASPPAASYLRMRTRVRIFIVILSVLVVLTT